MTLSCDICLSLSDLIHSVWQFLGSSLLLKMVLFHTFLWLSNIPCIICSTSFLSIPVDGHPNKFDFEI